MLKQAISPYSSQCVNAKGFYCERKEQEEGLFTRAEQIRCRFQHSLQLYINSNVRKQLEDKMNLKADSLKSFSS